MTHSAATRLSAWLLRARARRLPVDLAERLLEEWLAEMARMSPIGRLAFAVSLLLTRTTTLAQAGSAAETDALARAAATDRRRYVPARLSRRLVASLVDFAVISALGGIPYLLFAPSLESELLAGLLTGALSLALDAWLVMRYGASVGKLVMKLRVIATDSPTVTLRHALGRALPIYIVAALPQIVPLAVLVWTGAVVPNYGALSQPEQLEILRTMAPSGFLVAPLELFALAWLAVDARTAWLDPDHRSLHDRIGRTIVVYRDPQRVDRPITRAHDQAPATAR